MVRGLIRGKSIFSVVQKFASIGVNAKVCEHCCKSEFYSLRALFEIEYFTFASIVRYELEHIFSDIDKFYFMISCF